MTERFKVGDRVRIIGPSKDHDPDSYEMEWCEEMNHYIDSICTVCYVNTSDELPYYTLGNGDKYDDEIHTWGWYDDWLISADIYLSHTAWIVENKSIKKVYKATDGNVYTLPSGIVVESDDAYLMNVIVRSLNTHYFPVIPVKYEGIEI